MGMRDSNRIEIARWEEKKCWHIAFVFNGDVMLDTYGDVPMFLADEEGEIDKALSAYKAILKGLKPGYKAVWKGLNDFTYVKI